MNVTIPRQLQVRVRRHAHDFDMTTDEYVKKAIESALQDDADLALEMQAWEAASLHDFNEFARKHKL
jgi:hypothetical protein